MRNTVVLIVAAAAALQAVASLVADYVDVFAAPRTSHLTLVSRTTEVELSGRTATDLPRQVPVPDKPDLRESPKEGSGSAGGHGESERV